MTDIYWQADFQTTIDAFYAGMLAEGRAASEALLSLDDLPEEIDQQTRRNATFYLPSLRDIAPSFSTRAIDFAVPEGWSRFNPSIAANPKSDGFTMIVRSSNYTVARFMQYTIHDAAQIIRTTNYLVDLTADLQVVSAVPIMDGHLHPDPPPFPVAGFEDARLFWHRDAWWASATARDQNADGTCQIALLRLDDAAVTTMYLLSDGKERHEKNWMPAPDIASDTLRFVHSCYPTIILRYDDDLGGVLPERVGEAPAIAREFSGGSQVVPFDGGGLCLVHEAANFDNGSRVYSHRWVWFDASWQIARISPPFRLLQQGVEFAAGLAWSGTNLIISFGVWDREAHLGVISAAEVAALLAPPLNTRVVEQRMRAGTAPLASNSAQDLPVSEPVGDGITPFPASRPTIISTTLTGNSEAVIAGALRSVVDWVDWCLVIDTGVSDGTLEIARAVAGDKLVVRAFPWQSDFAAARNFALQAAADLGAGWAVTLDTDERLDLHGVDIAEALQQSEADALHVAHSEGTYAKERFFRLPAKGRFAGPTHEAYMRGGGQTASLTGVEFRELAKDQELYRNKVERDVAILLRHTVEHPDDPRWFYYLGDSYAGLGRNEEAIAAFTACANLRGWDEESAWAMYRAAECFLRLGKSIEAIEACAVGMSRHAGLAELPWLASFAAWQAGRPAQAVHWARVSILLGLYMGSGASVPRVGFRHPPALWEGPFDVLRHALRSVGDDDGADEAERVFQQALAAREAQE